MKAFELVWLDLVSQLKPGSLIGNWTAFRGDLGDKMTVTGIREQYIEISAPNAKLIQVVPKEDFKKVWSLWSDYKSRKLDRVHIREMTRYSKYIISILHWYERNVAAN